MHASLFDGMPFPHAYRYAGGMPLAPSNAPISILRCPIELRSQALHLLHQPEPVESARSDRADQQPSPELSSAPHSAVHCSLDQHPPADPTPALSPATPSPDSLAAEQASHATSSRPDRNDDLYDGLFVAVRNEAPREVASPTAQETSSARKEPPALVGAAWARIEPGRIAVIITPELVPGEADALGRALVAATDTFAAAHDVSLIQAALAPDDRRVSWFRDQGYSFLADLIYLASAKSAFPSEAPNTPLNFVRCGPERVPAELHERLVSVLEQTYVDTLDCPAINGLRNIEDVLEGYRATGTGDIASADPLSSAAPAAGAPWFLIQDGGKDIGCLLLADYATDEQWELVYVGLVPEARGHGFGRLITQHAQWLTGQAGRKRLVLAVDVMNQPAIRMYASCEFIAWAHRTVLVRVPAHSA